MTATEIHSLFSKDFDLVGVIETRDYTEHAKKLNRLLPDKQYSTMVVLAFAYPKRLIQHSQDYLIPSFYTFGRDYHLVMKEKIQSICDQLPFAYEIGVDNHPLDERLAAQVAGLGFLGRNQLLINKDFGSYIFLGMVMLDTVIDNAYKYNVLDNCGDCRQCIIACPTNAISDEGYDVNKCISAFNQSKKILSEDEIKANYSLFGCDICQLVCPKNIDKGRIIHNDFKLSGKEKVSILDMFTLSQKKFKTKYNDMAYLWRGKTLLMRNALTLLYNHNNKRYNHYIRESIDQFNIPWYKETAEFVLKKLEIN